MATKRWQTIALVALLAVLAAVLWYELSPPAGQSAAASKGETARESRGTAGQGSATPAVAEVKIAELSAPRPAPNEGDRNPFRFKPKPPPLPPSPPPGVGPTTTPTAPPLTTGPPPPPPINVKFIGIVEQEGVGKIAVLKDERGFVFHGFEGKIAAGRFLVVKIGVESIELAYPDGRGRTTIRLTGS